MTRSTFPQSLLICGYDLRGVTNAGQRNTRESGMVTRTHQLIGGFARRHPDTRLSVTITGARESMGPYMTLTPEGVNVSVREIGTQFPKHLRTNDLKDREKVQRFYEDEIDEFDNPIWQNLAGQYSCAASGEGADHILAQSINPLIAFLKAREYGWKPIPLTGVVNDTGPEFARRFGYLADRICAGSPVTVIAVSAAVRAELIDAGVPKWSIRTVLNGMDVEGFEARLRRAEKLNLWEKVCARNGVPRGRRVVLMSARRVEWKGAEDLIRAASRLAEDGAIGGACVVINGAGLLDTREPGFEKALAALIAERNLNGSVFLLDELTQDEVAACYVGADVCVHPSRKGEPFGYANLEAMLAGVPVITTNQGGPLEYIEHGESGVLVPPYSPNAIAFRLGPLLHDDDLRKRMGRAARASASRFTLEAMVSGYEAAITSVGVA